MIKLVVALAAEARPLIDAFDLRQESTRIFRGDGIELVLSGIGRAAAALATAELRAADGARRESAWLNVGLAGHQRHDLGRAFLARSVEDAFSGRTWFPPMLVTTGLPTATVRTVAQPETDYAADVLFEMEAAGFLATASRFAAAELVQVLKIVSDNRRVPASRLSAGLATRLVGGQLPAIGRVMEELRQVSCQLGTPRSQKDLQAWFERWHFTVIQRRQLERLLARLEVADDDGAPTADQLAREPSAGAVLAALREHLEDVSVSFQ